MALKDFIVAIELGSSKITGIAGKKNPSTEASKCWLASRKIPLHASVRVWFTTSTRPPNA